jgi:hypothetical protein
MGSKELCEVSDGQACLSNDGPNRARLEVSTGMYRNSHRQRGIERVYENMVTSDNTIEDKSGALQRSDDTPPIDDR